MTIRPSIMLILVLSLALLAVGIQFKRLQSAEHGFDIANHQLMQTSAEAEEMITLIAQQPRAALFQKPTDDVITLVNEILADAGIAKDSLSGLSPESDRMVSGGARKEAIAFRQQTMRLTLTDLTLSELGVFLQHWRVKARLWTLTHIDLAHHPSQQQSRNSNHETKDRYDITLRLRTLYVAKT